MNNQDEQEVISITLFLDWNTLHNKPSNGLAQCSLRDRTTKVRILPDPEDYFLGFRMA